MADWYDHPKYFDMMFSDETDAEVDFFKLAFDRFATGKIKTVLEPGCGSGRLVVAMAQHGYDVTGLDLNQAMLDYLDLRLDEEGLEATTVLGDMTEMRFRKRFDAAFCTFNTFRHLLSEDDAIKHLRSVASHVRSGGLYILGFHIIPLDADEAETEKWRSREGDLSIHTTLRVVKFNRAKRQERLRVIIKADKPDGEIERVRTEFEFRLYTHRQAKSLLKKVQDVFEIAGVYDFDYDIDEPREIDDDLTDAVFVLRRT